MLPGKHFITLLSLFAFSISHAQTVNDSMMHRFYSSHINNWNQLIYKAVSDSTISSFSDLSFSQPYSLNEAKQQGSLEHITPISNEEFAPVLDTVIFVPFNPKTGFVGMSFAYELIRGQNRETSTFELIGVAPNFEYVIYSGIEIGPRPLFWVQLKEVKSILDSADFTLLKHFASQVLAFGDLRPLHLKERRIYYPNTKAQVYLGDTEFMESLYTVSISSTSDSMHARYTNGLPSLALYKAAKMIEDGLTKKHILFKTVKLNKPYRHPFNEFGDTFVILEPTFKDDIRYLPIIQDEKIILRFELPQLVGESKHVYMAFIDARDFLRPIDYQILNTFLNEILH